MTSGPIRRAAVAGSWYPGEPRRLAEQLEGFLSGVEPIELEGQLVGLVSPHAGLVYSGPVAAHGYSLLRGRRAPANPWGGASLEWQCSSPPPPHNFARPPDARDPYDFGEIVYASEADGYVQGKPQPEHVTAT